MSDNSQLLSGVRVIESSLLGPGHVATFFADMGADVIKVEPPSGDYIRQMTWPIVNGVSLLHLHTHRGKKSVCLNLKTEEGKQLYKDLVKQADVVVEAMRPGSLAKLGLGYEALKKVNPKIVFATLSGYGATGPYKDMPSHGIAYDTWSGIVQPVEDDKGFKRIPPNMPNVGINVGPMLGAIAILAGVIKARETGEGCEMEMAQSDAAAYMDWYRIESERAYLRPEDEVTGNPSDDYVRRPAGLAGMWEGVRYQAYEASDGWLFLGARRDDLERLETSAGLEGLAGLEGDALERALETAQLAERDNVNVARLQVDTDKWMASKLNAQYDTRQRDVAINISVNDLHAQAAQLLGDVIEGEAFEDDD